MVRNKRLSLDANEGWTDVATERDAFWHPTRSGLLAIALACLTQLVGVQLVVVQAVAAQESMITRPESLPPSFGGEVHLDLVFPLSTRRLCPAEGECVVGIGGGIGGNAEWRFPSGFAVGAGYDAWFLDGNGVYELGVMQVIQLAGRYVFLQEWATHPFVGAAVGLVIFGETFRAATTGAAIDLKTGLEIEITPTLAFTGTAMLRLFSVAGFVSSSDGVSRASSFGVNAALSLSVGIRLTQQR